MIYKSILYIINTVIRILPGFKAKINILVIHKVFALKNADSIKNTFFYKHCPAGNRKHFSAFPLAFFVKLKKIPIPAASKVVYKPARAVDIFRPVIYKHLTGKYSALRFLLAIIY